MKRFSDGTQAIIDKYIKKLCDFAEDYTENERFLEPWDKDLQQLMEDFAWDIYEKASHNMIDPD